MPSSVRFGWVIVLLALGAPLGAEDPPGAQADRERVRALVEAGALPRKSLQKAEQDLRRARLQQTLWETLLSNDLAPDRIPDMLTAAAELRDMARLHLEHTRKLVEEGALPLNRLAPVKEEAELAERQHELATTKAQIIQERIAMARAEQHLDELEDEDLAFYSEEGFEGGISSSWQEDLLAIDAAFYQEFGRTLPISAEGQTALHESLGFDHAGRADIALHPDELEGQFLLHVLDSWGMPYIAFRSSVPGQSTGPHIHIGPRSDRLEADPDEPSEPASEPPIPSGAAAPR